MGVGGLKDEVGASSQQAAFSRQSVPWFRAACYTRLAKSQQPKANSYSSNLKNSTTFLAHRSSMAAREAVVKVETWGVQRTWGRLERGPL